MELTDLFIKPYKLYYNTSTILQLKSLQASPFTFLLPSDQSIQTSASSVFSNLSESQRTKPMKVLV